MKNKLISIIPTILFFCGCNQKTINVNKLINHFAALDWIINKSNEQEVTEYCEMYRSHYDCPEIALKEYYMMFDCDNSFYHAIIEVFQSAKMCDEWFYYYLPSHTPFYDGYKTFMCKSNNILITTTSIEVINYVDADFYFVDPVI